MGGGCRWGSYIMVSWLFSRDQFQKYKNRPYVTDSNWTGSFACLVLDLYRTGSRSNKQSTSCLHGIVLNQPRLVPNTSM